MLNSATYYSNTKTRLGYSFGGGVSHAFSKTLELKVRVLYEKKGSRTNSTATYIRDTLVSHTTRDVTTNLNFLTFSAMPTIHILPKKNLVFGIGAFYGLLKKAEVIAVITDINNPANNRTNVLTDPYNFPIKFEYGFSGYAGYVLPLSKKYDLTFMLHYNKSRNQFEDFYGTWQENRVLLLSATFGFLR